MPSLSVYIRFASKKTKYIVIIEGMADKSLAEYVEGVKILNHRPSISVWSIACKSLAKQNLIFSNSEAFPLLIAIAQAIDSLSSNHRSFLSSKYKRRIAPSISMAVKIISFFLFLGRKFSIKKFTKNDLSVKI